MARPLPAALLERLTALHTEPGRHYHGLTHVQALLRQFGNWRERVGEPHLIDAAIWFHDAVYDPLRPDNEERSAALARAELTAIDWPRADIERVAELVLATRGHCADDGDAAAWLFLDLDLGILGQDPTTYARYAEDVRAEYAAVPPARYRARRAAVLRGLLARDPLYRTPTLHAAWEAAARANLQAELATLDTREASPGADPQSVNASPSADPQPGA